MGRSWSSHLKSWLRGHVFRLRTLQHLAIVALAAFSATTLQGCLPPDWSFCDCDFRDNFWNHVLNDVHLLWDGSDLQRVARDNRTFQGRYLQGPMPDGYDCPMVADSFWKSWPRFGLTRGLIEGSMGDLWMPGARDRIKMICMAGHLALSAICSQHFLVRAAKGIEAGETDYMRWMEAAYGHMVAIRNLGHDYRLRQCMGQQGWSLKVAEFHKYTERWIGREAEGTTPVAAYMGGQLDPYQMLFNEPMHHTARSRLDALPDRRPCVPFKDPRCWKRMSKLLIETCEYCCSPFEHKTGRGSPWCFDSVYTYERCCQDDFKDLVCDLKRKGEEGGCVDCAKSVQYICLTPPEKRLQDAQDNYNAKVDRFNSLQADSQRLAKEIVAARTDLFQKNEVYQGHYQDFDKKLRIWSESYNNFSRLISESRLQQQRRTWNASSQVLLAAQDALRTARESLRQATETLRSAEEEKRRGEETVARNETAHAAATSALANAYERVFQAEAAQRAAQAAASEAATAAARAAAAHEARRNEGLAANRSRDRLFADTDSELDAALVAKHTAAAVVATAASEDEAAAAAVGEAAAANATALGVLEGAEVELAQVVGLEAEASRAVEAAVQAVEEARLLLLQRRAELEAIRRNEAEVHEALLNASQAPTAVRCLLDRTPANASARPQLLPACPAGAAASAAAVAPPPEPEAPREEAPPPADQNENCPSWAASGECDRNPKYMLKVCARSCRKEPEVAADPASASSSGPSSACSQVDVASVVAELAGIAASLSASEGAGEDPETTRILDEYRAKARDALAALEAARESERWASGNVTGAQGALAAAEGVLKAARDREAAARAMRDRAQEEADAASASVGLWEGFAATNATALAGARADLERRTAERGRAKAAADEALSVKRGLDKASRLAEEAAGKAQAATARERGLLEVLDEHIATLNASMSENLTTAVSAWLAEREAAESAGTGWGAKLLKAAKTALLSMVSSIETFLETYVVSLTDKDSVLELVRAVEDRKAATRKLAEAERAAADAEAQAGAARSELRKSEEALKAAQQAAKEAGERVQEGELAVQAASDSLELAESGLSAAKARLALAQQDLRDKVAQFEEAAQAASVAVASAERERDALRANEAAWEAAKAAEQRAVQGVADADRELAHAAANAERLYLARLREGCGASEVDFETYAQHRELVGLLHAVVAQRLEALTSAEATAAGAAANQMAAEAAQAAAKESVAAADAARLVRAGELAATSGRLGARLAERNLTATALAAAQEELGKHTAHVERLQASRAEAVGKASAAAAAAADAKIQADESTRLCDARRADLRTAVNATATRVREMEAAEAAKLAAKHALEQAKAWLEMFVPTLLIDEKNRTLQEATAEEKRSFDQEVAAARREKRMSQLLRTHERHLALLNAQVELTRKDDERGAAKVLFTISEKAVVDAQEKLEGLLKDEATCHKDIAETYQELQKLLEEHGLATEAYNKQDPEERKRSFSTSLQGSGAGA